MIRCLSRLTQTLVLTTPLLLFTGGCETVDYVMATLDLQGAPGANLQTPRYYPETMPVGEPLEIEIVRQNRKRITIDNRTTQPWDGGRIWLNRQYGAVIDEIPVGKSQNIALIEFVNLHGEQFPVGSFLAPEKSRDVIAADLEANGQLHKLVVRLADDWQEP